MRIYHGSKYRIEKPELLKGRQAACARLDKLLARLPWVKSLHIYGVKG